MPGVTTLTRLGEVSLRELARGAVTTTRPRPELEVDIEFVHESTFDDGFPQIEILGDQPILVDPDFAATLRFTRQDASASWFDKPEDVIALVGDPEPIASPWMSLRIPLALIGFGAVAAVTLAWLLG